MTTDLFLWYKTIFLWQNNLFTSFCVQITRLQTFRLCAVRVTKMNFLFQFCGNRCIQMPHQRQVTQLNTKNVRQGGCSVGGWVRQTGPSPRRPLLTSQTKPKVNVDLLKCNLKLRSVKLFVCRMMRPGWITQRNCTSLQHQTMYMLKLYISFQLFNFMMWQQCVDTWLELEKDLSFKISSSLTFTNVEMARKCTTCTKLQLICDLQKCETWLKTLTYIIIYLSVTQTSSRSKHVLCTYIVSSSKHNKADVINVILRHISL